MPRDLRLASWLLPALVLLGCGSTIGNARTAPLPGRFVLEAQTGLRLDAVMARVRELVESHVPGEPIRDAKLEEWLSDLAVEVRGATGRGRLPFAFGEPRTAVTPVSSHYAGRERVVVDDDLATTSVRLGSVNRAFVIIDGDAHLGFVRDSIVLATGTLNVAHAYDSVILAGAGLDVSHASGFGGNPSQLPSLLVTGTDVRVAHAHGAIFAAAEGIASTFDGRVTFVSSPAVELLGQPSFDTRLILSDIAISPHEASLEAGVDEGAIPRVCVYWRGRDGGTCANQGELLSDTLADWRVSFSSPRLVVLANGRERIRLVPTREVSSL